MRSKWFIVATILMLIVGLTGIVEAQSAAGVGTLEFVIAGNTISGNLSNSRLYSDKTVTMGMTLDYITQTSVGPVSVTGAGDWYGRANRTALEGIIYNVSGTVKLCYIFYCPTASYIGYGTWSGALTNNSTQAAGTFHCILIFTSSEIQNIPLNTPLHVAGTWNSTLQASE